MPEPAEEFGLRNGREKGGAGGDFADAQVPQGDGVEGAFVKLEELPVLVDQDTPLQWHLGVGVVSNLVVREVVDHFEREDEAWRVDVFSPVEDRAVEDLRLLEVAFCIGGA